MNGMREPQAIYCLLLVETNARPYIRKLRTNFKGWRIIVEKDSRKAMDFFFHNDVDAILVNHSADASCLDLLNFFKSLKPTVPVIIVSDAGSEDFNLPCSNVKHLFMASGGTSNETVGRP